MRCKTIVIALVILASVTAWAREPYVPQLLRAMEREGWDSSETGALEGHLHQYRWDEKPQVDPAVVAFALGAAARARYRIPAEEAAKLAYQVAITGGELRGLGYEERDIARAAAESVRAVLTVRDRDRNGEADMDLAQRVRAELREQVHAEEQLASHQRTQVHTAADGVPGPGPGGR